MTAPRWVAAHAPALGIDPAHIAVGGDRAGANLAAVLALTGCDGTAPRSSFQLLLYPATDFGMQTGYYARVTEGVPLTAAAMRWFIDHYAPGKAMRTDWRPPCAPPAWPARRPPSC